MIDDLQPGEAVTAEKIDRISRMLFLEDAEKLPASIRTKGAGLAGLGIIDLGGLVAGVQRTELAKTACGYAGRRSDTAMHERTTTLRGQLFEGPHIEVVQQQGNGMLELAQVEEFALAQACQYPALWLLTLPQAALSGWPSVSPKTPAKQPLALIG